MSFREDMVDSIQNIGSIEQRFEQIDLCAFDIHLEKPDVFIQVFEIRDKIDLLDLDGSIFTELLTIEAGVLLDPSV